MTCESCGAALPPTAKFCLECGTPVATAPATQEVRKTVTLLFTDVTGSTALGEQLDPEAYRTIMGRYFDVARAAVERHGGTVEKFVGDAVLAVFGVPEVREDDALRAVRAAAELNADVQALGAELFGTLGIRLEIRTGVNTGAVVAGSARAGGSFATGDAVNTAARLEQAASPGQVLLGASTHDLVRDAVDVEDVDPVPAKGKAEPVPAYRLLAVHDTERGRARRGDTTLVGREREIRVLQDALERTLETGRGHLVTVVGAPGIGKSRLISEFLADVGDRAEVITSRCVSYGSGITFWPIVQLLRQALDLHGGESDEVTRHALARLMDGSPDEDRVTDLLLAVLGHSGVPGSSEQTFWAVRRALEQLAARRPLVVTVDDLHWAEPTLLELLEQVRDQVRDLPLLLVCQARPELLDEHPAWGGGSVNSLTFGLEPFTDEQTADSLTALLGDRIAPDVAAAVARWAGGNPLFVEEAVDHLVDRGLLQGSPDGWVLVGSLSDAHVPPTVAALLSARLDRLPEPELRLVERISIVGLEVSTEEAVTLADGELSPAEVVECLAGLVRRDLLQRRRLATGDVWSFRHLMVRDAAYDSLPKALRAELHERFADRTAQLADEVGAERLAFVAHHLESALRFRQELARHDPGLGALARRAAESLAEAADDARDREDLPAAMSLLRRAVVLEPLDGAQRRDLLVRLTQLLSDVERVDEARTTLAELAAITDDSASPLDRAALEVLVLHNRLAAAEPVDPREVADAARRCAELAREAREARRLTIALYALANCSMMEARWLAVESILKEMATVASAQDQRYVRVIGNAAIVWGPSPMSRLLAHVEDERSAGRLSPGDEIRLAVTEGLASAAVGRPDAADLLRANENLTDERFFVVYRLLILGATHLLLGDIRGCVSLFDQGVSMMLDSGDLSHASTQLAWIACLRLELDDPPDEVAPILGRAADATSPYDVISVALVEAARGLLGARRGEHDAAAASMAEALRVVDSSDQLWQQAEVRRWASMVARLRGDPAEERRLLEESLDAFRRKEIVVWAQDVESRLAELGG